MVTPSTPGAPRLVAHVAPGPAQDVAAGDLVVQGMEPACGILLGTAVEHALQGTDLSRPSAWLMDLAAHGALTRSSLLRRASMKQGSFPPAGLCCPGRRTTTTPSDCLSAARHFPGSPVIGRHASRTPQAGAEEALSSSQDNLLTVPRPYAGGFMAPAPGSQVPSMAFASHTGSAPSWPLTRVSLRRSQASLDAADRPVAAPSQGLRRSASTPGSRPTPGAALPGTLASPRTGLPPAGCRELVARLRHDVLLSHGARATGRTMEPEPSLVGRCRLLLIRMGTDQGGIEIDHIEPGIGTGRPRRPRGPRRGPV